jgi:hypothetical protein
VLPILHQLAIYLYNDIIYIYTIILAIITDTPFVYEFRKHLPKFNAHTAIQAQGYDGMSVPKKQTLSCQKASRKHRMSSPIGSNIQSFRLWKAAGALNAHLGRLQTIFEALIFVSFANIDVSTFNLLDSHKLC